MADVSVWEKPALEGHVGPFEIPSLEVKRIDELFYGNPDTSHVAVSYIDLSLVSGVLGKCLLSTRTGDDKIAVYRKKAVVTKLEKSIEEMSSAERGHKEPVAILGVQVFGCERPEALETALGITKIVVGRDFNYEDFLQYDF